MLAPKGPGAPARKAGGARPGKASGVGAANGQARRLDELTRELREANDDLKAFAYALSHELRAPLRAMRGFGQALLEDYGSALDDAARDFTNRIVGAADQMDALIHDLLDHNRVSRSQLPLQTVDLLPVAEQALRLNHEEIEDAGAQVANNVPPCAVVCDVQTMVLVLAHLISNAVKFSRPAVPPLVMLGAERTNGRVRIVVEDNGIGIAEEHLERIFRMFERLHGVEDYPGTGIGLAIVKRGVERMGGRVGVTSALGKGSTFWIELPAPDGG